MKRSDGPGLDLPEFSSVLGGDEKRPPCEYLPVPLAGLTASASVSRSREELRAKLNVLGASWLM